VTTLNLYGNIPEMLKERPNWVAFGIRDAPPKAPYNPRSLLAGGFAPAKAGARETWGTFEDAARCVARGLARGVGYEFDGGGLYGVDLDHVIGEDGTLTPEAREIADGLNSYTEVSPSGTGLHIFVLANQGAEIARHRKKDGFVEIYGEARYFTVTGNAYGGVKPIADRTAELQTVHDKFLSPETERKPVTRAVYVPATSAEQDRFLNMGLARDKVFAALWNGERRHGNESADDQALMNKLAYWLSADTDAMTRAFLQSPHCAQKGETHRRKCQRTDYLPNTARKAASTVYSTARADYERWTQNRQRERKKGYAR
jgi:putative DNA primase/helicase